MFAAESDDLKLLGQAGGGGEGVSPAEPLTVSCAETDRASTDIVTWEAEEPDGDTCAP